jgi:riboflavin synthase
MFTGIIEEIGRTVKISSIPNGKKLEISASKILADLQVNHSVAVSGVCLTVINVKKKSFTVEAVGETLKKTTLARIRQNQPVNLERAIQMNDRLGGHLIQGHINGIGRIKKINKKGENWYLEIIIPKELSAYVIDEGSISIDGISLTIAYLENTNIGISIIPHTFKNTVISSYKTGQEVNIEVDFLAKYVEKFLNKQKYQKNGKMIFTKEWFETLGY